MKRAGGIALVVLLLAGSFWLGRTLTRSPSSSAQPTVAERADPGPKDPAIEEVRQALRSSFYRPVGTAVLAEPTIPEMLEELGDPNTDYLTEDEYDDLKKRTAKSYSGVGLTVEPSRAGLIVTSALEGPAKQAGIRRGDVIVRIDGRPTGKLSFERSLALIKGQEGTLVRLTVERPNRGTLRFTVVRREIAVPSVRTRLLTFRRAKVGYLRLLSFPDGSAEKIRLAATKLVARGAKGMVLDLRENPGGLLAQAVRSVSVFLDKGVVCTTRGLHQDETVYEVSGVASYPKLPLVILVNRRSASAAEIVASALQDHERALVVGQRTYGKASVQSIRPLSNGTALKLTTATYVRPSGVDLGERGVRPDVKALDDPHTRPDEALRAAERALLEQIRG